MSVTAAASIPVIDITPLRDGSDPRGVARQLLDASLVEMLTPTETIEFFGRLRGISLSSLKISSLLKETTLLPYADKLARNLSGGNKRKLSLALAALCGEGGVLLLDEISSGVDPSSRREITRWTSKRSSHHAIILTSHLMDEVNALASRVAIMEQGELISVGSVQQLKSNSSIGFTLQVCIASEDDADQVIEAVLKTLLGSELKERHGRYITFEVPKACNLGLGECFRRLQELKESESPIENYIVKQCSLEQIFLSKVAAASAKRTEQDVEED